MVILRRATLEIPGIDVLDHGGEEDAKAAEEVAELVTDLQTLLIAHVKALRLTFPKCHIMIFGLLDERM